MNGLHCYLNRLCYCHGLPQIGSCSTEQPSNNKNVCFLFDCGAVWPRALSDCSKSCNSILYVNKYMIHKLGRSSRDFFIEINARSSGRSPRSAESFCQHLRERTSRCEGLTASSQRRRVFASIRTLNMWLHNVRIRSRSIRLRYGQSASPCCRPLGAQRNHW